jgi:competence protein ComEA
VRITSFASPAFPSHSARPEVGVEEEPLSGLAARWHACRSDRRIVASLCACIALAAAFAWWRAGASGASVAAAPTAAPNAGVVTPPASSSSTTVASRLVVDIVGAVRAPGVVRVAAGARVVDAIAAAGGATAEADLTRLNLAAPVADGARIAVPRAGQPALPVDPGAVSGGVPDDNGGAAAGPVNINSATASQLDALPGIGPATAQAIVSDREQHGPFASVDDLARVRGIGPAKLAQLRPLVTT